MNFPPLPGIYCFYNKQSKKLYIGSAKNLKERIRHHLSGHNSNEPLQCSIKKHSLKAFTINFWILKDWETAKAEEQLWLDWVFSNKIKTFNLSTQVSSCVLQNYDNHRQLSEAGGSCKAKQVFALNINSLENKFFESNCEAAKSLIVGRSRITGGCKSKKPIQTKTGRFILSALSLEDCYIKFNNLSSHDLTPNNSYSFVLYEIKTRRYSQEFNSTYEPKRQGYDLGTATIGASLMGYSNQIANGYIILCTIKNKIIVTDSIKEFKERFNNKLAPSTLDIINNL